MFCLHYLQVIGQKQCFKLKQQSHYQVENYYFLVVDYVCKDMLFQNIKKAS